MCGWMGDSGRKRICRARRQGAGGGRVRWAMAQAARLAQAARVQLCVQLCRGRGCRRPHLWRLQRVLVREVDREPEHLAAVEVVHLGALHEDDPASHGLARFEDASLRRVVAPLAQLRLHAGRSGGVIPGTPAPRHAGGVRVCVGAAWRAGCRSKRHLDASRRHSREVPLYSGHLVCAPDQCPLLCLLRAAVNGKCPSRELPAPGEGDRRGLSAGERPMSASVARGQDPPSRARGWAAGALAEAARQAAGRTQLRLPPSRPREEAGDDGGKSAGAKAPAGLPVARPCRSSPAAGRRAGSDRCGLSGAGGVAPSVGGPLSCRALQTPESKLSAGASVMGARGRPAGSIPVLREGARRSRCAGRASGRVATEEGRRGAASRKQRGRKQHAVNT
jgi:hypothetical protein